MSREWRSFLEDMRECCRRVKGYVAGMDRAALESNQLVCDAVLRNLEIIGEAAKRIPPEIRQQMPQIEWSHISGMRDWLAHGYFQVNMHIVWDVVENKLSALDKDLSEFLRNHPPSPDVDN